MYAVKNDTGIKFNIVLYIKIIFVGQGVGIQGPQPRNVPLDKIQRTKNRHSWFVAIGQYAPGIVPRSVRWPSQRARI